MPLVRTIGYVGCVSNCQSSSALWRYEPGTREQQLCSKSVASFSKKKQYMRLYVGNLSFDTTEDELRTAFEPFGTVADVTIMRDHNTERSRGFGFVTLSNATEGRAAIEGMHGKNLHGRNLTVNEARPREDRPSGGSGGGGGGFRRFSGGKRPYNGSRRS